MYQSFVTMTSTSEEVRNIDGEIERLKLQLVSGDTKGHCCQYCSDVKITFCESVPEQPDGSSYYSLETMEEWVRTSAALGCNFWSMISDRLAFVRAREKGFPWLFGANQSERERRNPLLWVKELGTCWDDVHVAPAPSGPDVDPSLSRSRPPKNTARVLKDLLRLTFRSNAVKCSLEVTLEILETSGNSEQLASKCFALPIWSASKSQATLWALVPPINLFKMGNKRTLPIGSPINLEPGSPSTVNLIKCWLRKCEVQHGCDILELPSSMPTMILRVLSRDFAVLVEVAPKMRKRYLALSYCWGQQTQSLLLTRRNEPSLRSEAGIRIAQLDPTIRDAMVTTFELGFEYLWIDALCIFQDDEAFKVRELRKMGSIYRNATFTIVPSAASDVREGFLKKRRSTLESIVLAGDHLKPVFRMEAEWKDDSSKETTPFSAIVLSTKDMKLEKSPWNQRGWTLQEDLFNRRRLQYREQQTTWRCYCAGEKVLEDDDGWISGGETPPSLGLVTSMLWNRSNCPETATVFGCWYSLVREYSSRQLRYARDRLPAISSVAREFSSILGDQYICGLWKSDLALGSAWSAAEGRPCYSYNSLKGPSWSWTSYMNGVYWSSFFQDWEYRKSEDFQVLGTSHSSRPLNDLFRYAGPSELHLRGLLMPCFYDSHLPGQSIRSSFSTRPSSLHTTDPSVLIYLDFREDHRLQEPSKVEIQLLALIVTCDLNVEGVILREMVKRPGKYFRVGSFTMVGVWPESTKCLWGILPGESTKWPARLPEDYQAQMRIAFGGDKNIRNIVLV